MTLLRSAVGRSAAVPKRERREVNAGNMPATTDNVAAGLAAVAANFCCHLLSAAGPPVHETPPDRLDNIRDAAGVLERTHRVSLPRNATQPARPVASKHRRRLRPSEPGRRTKEL